MSDNKNVSVKPVKRIMVPVEASAESEKLIRTAQNLAALTGKEWIAINVETGTLLNDQDKKIILDNCNLARELGAEVITTSDMDIINSLIRVAKENNVDEIVAGKKIKKRFGKKNQISRLIENSEDIDIYLSGENIKEEPAESWGNYFNFKSSWVRYFTSVIIVFIVANICYSIYNHIGYQTVSLLFLLTVSLMPLFNFGPGPTFLAALLSALSWNYFFIPPQYTFHIYRVEDVLMFIMYFIVASVTGTLTARIRSQEIFVRQREKRTNALYSLSKDLSSSVGRDIVAGVAVNNIKKFFDVDAIIIFPDKNNKLHPASQSIGTFTIDDGEWQIAQWAYLNGQKAGRFSDILPLAEAIYYPLKSSRFNLGVLGVKVAEEIPLSFDQQTYLESFITQIITTLEREYLNDVAKESLLVSESEKLYKTLFNSISHELKTPITTIITAASSFNNEEVLKKGDLVKSISAEINIAAERLKRLVENLLDMARLESGVLKLKLDWHDVSDLIYGVVNRLRSELASHKLVINIQKGIKFFKFDYGLLEQSIINILHNSVTYTSEGSEISIEVKEEDDSCIICVSDNGRGFSNDSLPKLFNKFYREPHSKSGGTGLGLSIAKGFIEAHNGTVTAANLESGGAIIKINIPMVN